MACYEELRRGVVEQRCRRGAGVALLMTRGVLAWMNASATSPPSGIMEPGAASAPPPVNPCMPGVHAELTLVLAGMALNAVRRRTDNVD